MFFGDAFAGSFFNFFATHPPLAERIRRLDPDFDGRFPEVVKLTASEADRRPLTAATARRAEAAVAVTAMGLDSPRDGAAASAEPVPALPSQSPLPSQSAVDPQRLEYSGRMVAGMPPMVAEAAREPSAARAVVFALLLSRDDAATRNRQMEILRERVEPHLCELTAKLAAPILGLRPEMRLPLASLTVPALKRFSQPQYVQFAGIVSALVAADGKVDLFEYCLQVMLSGCLDMHFGLKRAPAVRYRTTASVTRPAAMILSSLAYAGQSRPDEIDRAFQAGIQGRFPQAALVARPQCTLAALDSSWAN